MRAPNSGVPEDQSDRLGGRNGEIWTHYRRGRTQQWIADKYGINQATVSKILAEVRKSLPEDARVDWRVQALETLASLHAEMAELAEAEPQPVYDRDGEQIGVNRADQFAAVDRLIKLQERAAKLLGLDAPAKTEAAVVVDASDEVTALLERARAARRGGGAS